MLTPGLPGQAADQPRVKAMEGTWALWVGLGPSISQSHPGDSHEWPGWEPLSRTTPPTVPRETVSLGAQGVLGSGAAVPPTGPQVFPETGLY